MPHPSSGYKIGGERVPGTTTIIGRFKESGGLIWWAFRQGQANPDARSPYDATEKAASIGSLAHDWVERHIHGDITSPLDEILDVPQDIFEAAQQAYQAYVKWEKLTQVKIVATEMQLVSEEYEFGGCPDAIFQMPDGSLELGDWKTSNSTYPDHLIQLAAYGLLWDENRNKVAPKLGIPNVPFTGYNLLRFAKDAPDFHHHRFEKLDDEREQFLLFRRAYEIDKAIKKRVK